MLGKYLQLLKASELQYTSPITPGHLAEVVFTWFIYKSLES